MNSRDHLEGELERLVKARDLKGIVDLLAFIESEREQGLPSSVRLNYVNAKGESLLHVALSDKNPDLAICQFLFERLKEDEVLLSDNHKGYSLVWLATRRNLPELALMLIKYQSSAPHFADHPQKESWLRASKKGATPLHLAASLPASDLFEFLLAHGDLEKPNVHGDAPLMYAAVTPQLDTLVLLINHDADLYASNVKGITFFTLFDKLNEEQKLIVFRKIKNDKQIEILNYYRKKLSSQWMLTDAERDAYDALYSKFMSQRVAVPGSLQELILSKMPYDTEAEFSEIDGFSDDVLRILPHFRKVQENKTQNQVLNEDRENVKALMEMANTYSYPIRTRGFVPSTWRVNVGVTAIVMGIVMGLATLVSPYMVGMFATSSSIIVPATMLVSLLSISPVLAIVLIGVAIFVVGCVLTALVLSLGALIFRSDLKFTGVVHEELKPLTDTLNQEILCKLQALEKNDEKALPVSKDVIRDLARFDQHLKSTPYSENYEMTWKFDSLKENLTKILTGLNETKKPFSSVPTPVEKQLLHHPLPKRIKISSPGEAQPKEIKISSLGEAQPKEIKISSPGAQRGERTGVSPAKAGEAPGEGGGDLHSRERSESPLRSNKRRPRTPSPGASAPVLSPRSAPGEDSSSATFFVSGSGFATRKALDETKSVSSGLRPGVSHA